MYWDKIEKYLTVEDSTKQKDTALDAEDEDSSNYGGEEEFSFDIEKQKLGLQTLLNIILMIHQKKDKGSKWARAFDFTDCFRTLRYALPKDGKKVNPVKLREFIISLKKEIDNDPDEFINYYYDNFDVLDNMDAKFKTNVYQNWKYLSDSMNIIIQTEKIFKEARIGVIKLNNASPLDAQNIFSRVNRGGTLLKAEELLSAKPFWNVPVNTNNFEVKDKVNKMYKKLDVDPTTIVRWDLAATLISRIDKNHLIFDPYKESEEKGEIDMDQVTLGFKLLSSVFEGGMSGKNVNGLETNKKINWERDIDILVDDLNKLCDILLNDNYFKYLHSWKRPLTKLLGNAIALEFITIILKDWYDKDKIVVDSADLKSLKRNAKILLDRLIFEYATKVWRGSGDSKMATDIKNYKTRIVPIDKKEWLEFVEKVSYGEYNGQVVARKSLTPVLYHHYALNEMKAEDKFDISFDVDHIIPQEKFKDNPMIDQKLKDSLGNLCILPKKDNITKKSKALNEVTDKWLKSNIVVHTGIQLTDFDKFSNVANIKEMIDFRKNNYINSFDEQRDKILSN